MPELSDLINERTILVRADAEDDRDVIRSLAAALHQEGHVTPGFADAAIARESTSPTGLSLGDDVLGAAIPHAEREFVLRPSVAIATLARPVSFARMDEPESRVDVGLVLMPALPDSASQVETLRAVGTLLQDPALITDLAEASSAAEILALLRSRLS